MIYIKVLDKLDQSDRNIKWLSDKTDINYSTLYNFIHKNTNAVSYDVLEKLCKFYECGLSEIIDYEPDITIKGQMEFDIRTGEIIPVNPDECIQVYGSFINHRDKSNGIHFINDQLQQRYYNDTNIYNNYMNQTVNYAAEESQEYDSSLKFQLTKNTSIKAGTKITVSDVQIYKEPTTDNIPTTDLFSKHIKNSTPYTMRNGKVEPINSNHKDSK